MTAMDRKEFFSFVFQKAAGKSLKWLALPEQPVSAKDPAAHRPPGAVPYEQEFLAKCTGCDACMAACPVNIVMIADLERRDPVIYPESGPCVQCPGFPCIAACPTGALDKRYGTLLRLVIRI